MNVDPYKIEIFLDQKILHPGQKLTGTVILDLQKALSCSRIEVQLFGSARVFFVQQITKPTVLLQNKAFEQEIILLDQTKNVYDDGSKPKQLTLDEIARKSSSTAIRFPTQKSSTISSGTHEYQFGFDLPAAGLYTSFDAKGAAGYVRYYILVKCFNGPTVVRRQKLLFPIVVPVVLTLDPTPEIVLDRYVKTSKGLVTVKLQLAKNKFLPGEAVNGVVTINNQTTSSIKKAHLYIVQDTVCYAVTPESQFQESQYKTPGMGLPQDKVTAGNSLQYPIRFNIPALVPGVLVDGCIHMQYQLCLDVGFEREINKGTIAQITVPIEIGTHISADAPPPYDSLDFSVSSAPPGYNQSVTGLTETFEAEFSNLYNPMCCYYSNPGFEKDENSKKNE
ncbi:unnamed protein product [Bursaphelenchus okinawaensis]|uniref:Arrestin C-terminal-like domain-containing protein n=1 Tax=Bursaphelenchus okinawaensis TaxID=465554 RepID=A0A811K5Z5_9BILA|nr:unnamed protein product [Bursaphelenchus okinawaensis]CAG9093475.1 unnamed protein product [Bursaphelenchus okinawaensis]